MNRRLRCFVPAAAAAALTVLLVSASSASATLTLPQPKGYSVVVAPASVPGGTATTMTATITNETLIRVESADAVAARADGGRRIAAPAGMTAPTVSTCGAASVPCVQAATSTSARAGA